MPDSTARKLAARGSAGLDAAQHGLAATLHSRHVALIAMGGIIGAGLFVGSSGAILQAGPGVVVSYALAGLIVLLIMRMLGEMALARPGLGSFSDYAAHSLGPWAGFMIGWLYWYFWVIVVGAETVAGATLLQPVTGWPVWALGLLLITLMTAVNLLSVRSYGEFEFWFSTLKVGAIGLFIVVGLSYLLGWGPPLAHTRQILGGHGGIMPHGVTALFAAIPVVVFSMMGSEVATIAAAESSAPAGNVARATRTVALRILVFYVASVAVIVSIVPWDSLSAVESPFVSALREMGVPAAAGLMRALVVVAVLSCLNSGLYITSRTLHTLARRGDAPGVLAATSRARVPVWGIVLGAALGYAAALCSIVSPQGVFLFLLNTSGAIILFIYLLVAWAQLRFRRAVEREGLPNPLPMWLFPWLSWITVLAILAILLAMAVTPGLRWQFVLSSGSVLLVAALWRIVPRSLPRQGPPSSGHGPLTNRSG